MQANPAADIQQSRVAARFVRTVFVLALAASAAILIHGYHWGVDDQFVYLSAIKYDLDPSLYPQDSAFILAEARYTLFDELVAWTAGTARLPVEWAVLLWHWLSFLVLLLGAWQVSRRVFAEPSAQWASVGLGAALLIVPIGGTQVFLAEPYLHPRNLALGLLLLAQGEVLVQSWRAILWLVLAGLVHPTMAVYGAYHLGFQLWRFAPQAGVPTLLVAGEWFSNGTPQWRAVLETRWFLYPHRWPWYAHVGVILPIGALVWFGRIRSEQHNGPLGRLGKQLAWSAALAAVFGVIVGVTPALIWFLPKEPMRALHFPVFMAVLLGGGLLGQAWLRTRVGRWLTLFVPLCAIVMYARMSMYPASPHLEFPAYMGRNAWAESFEWVRENTPRDAYFALDPSYTRIPGEDSHSFRALAERSMLADFRKDRGVVSLAPELTDTWQRQVDDRKNWKQFTAEDFRRLRRVHGVNWVVLEAPGGAGLDCPYNRRGVLVCRVDEPAERSLSDAGRKSAPNESEFAAKAARGTGASHVRSDKDADKAARP